jgi:hypothetical protein
MIRLPGFLCLVSSVFRLPDKAGSRRHEARKDPGCEGDAGQAGTGLLLLFACSVEDIPGRARLPPRRDAPSGANPARREPRPPGTIPERRGLQQGTLCSSLSALRRLLPEGREQGAESEERANTTGCASQARPAEDATVSGPTGPVGTPRSHRPVGEDDEAWTRWSGPGAGSSSRSQPRRAHPRGASPRKGIPRARRRPPLRERVAAGARGPRGVGPIDRSINTGRPRRPHCRREYRAPTRPGGRRSP